MFDPANSNRAAQSCVAEYERVAALGERIDREIVSRTQELREQCATIEGARNFVSERLCTDPHDELAWLIKAISTVLDDDELCAVVRSAVETMQRVAATEEVERKY